MLIMQQLLFFLLNRQTILIRLHHATKMMAGDFSGANASITTGLVGDFSNAAGKYILATPTDGADHKRKQRYLVFRSFYWSPTVGLDLPTLPEGWKYEGWVVFERTTSYNRYFYKHHGH